MNAICSDDWNYFPGADQICPAAAGFICWGFSVATNVACTILIWLKSWRHRKLLRSLNLPSEPYRMSTEKALTLLVESGFIYSIVWIQIVVYLHLSRDSPWIYLSNIVATLANQIGGLYPTLVIVIVNFRASM
ncbi:hypothetical protein C8R45DRAFT_874524, partial [Mycena sanguinolenta]